MYFYTHITGSMSPLPGCRSRLVLKEGAPGYGDEGARKPVVATDNGFNRNVTGSKWYSDTVDKNMLFYAQIHNLDISLGKTNKGAAHAAYFEHSSRLSSSSCFCFLLCGCL